MKRIFLTLIALLVATHVYAADTKIQALTDITSPVVGDDLLIIDDPDVTPLDRKINVGALIDVITGDVTCTTGVCTLDASVVADNEIDYGNVTGADLTLTDAGAITSTGTITAAVGFDCTGAADCDIGSGDILDITLTEDGGAYIFNNGLSMAGETISAGVITSTGFTIGAAAILEAELEILDGATLTTSELNIPLDGALVTLVEFQQLENIAANTVSAAQWTGLGTSTTAGLALLDDAAASNQLVTLGLSATAAEINTPLDGATVTLTEFEELATMGATIIETGDWTAVAALVGTNTGDDVHLRDLVTTAPLTGGTDDVFVGTDADITVAIPLATTSQDGYISQTDWDTFNDHAASSTQAHSDYMLNTGDTATGDYNFGVGTTSFEIPNSATVTDPNVAGEVAIDTTTDQFLYFGASQRILHYEHINCGALQSATNVTVANDYPIFTAPANITIVGVSCQVTGTSATIDFEDDADTNIEAAITCDVASPGTWDEAIAGTATIVKGEAVEFDVTAASAATSLLACVRWVYDAD